MRGRTCRHVLGAALGGALLLAACEEETRFVPPPDASTQDTSQTPDVPIEEDTRSPEGYLLTESARFGWKLPETAPTPNPACDPAHTFTHEASVPWRGFEHNGTLYTCNRCPGGDPVVQGKWRYTHDPDNVDVTSPSGLKETLTITGNRFHLKTSDKGKLTTIEGWYWCGSKPEVANGTTAFVIEKVTTEGTCTDPTPGACYEPGLVFSSYLLVDMQANGLLWQQMYGFETTTTKVFTDPPYCRVGQMSLGKECVDELQ